MWKLLHKRVHANITPELPNWSQEVDTYKENTRDPTIFPSSLSWVTGYWGKARLRHHDKGLLKQTVRNLLKILNHTHARHIPLATATALPPELPPGTNHSEPSLLVVRVCRDLRLTSDPSWCMTGASWDRDLRRGCRQTFWVGPCMLSTDPDLQ